MKSSFGGKIIQISPDVLNFNRIAITCTNKKLQIIICNVLSFLSKLIKKLALRRVRVSTSTERLLYLIHQQNKVF